MKQRTRAVWFSAGLILAVLPLTLVEWFVGVAWLRDEALFVGAVFLLPAAFLSLHLTQRARLTGYAGLSLWVLFIFLVPLHPRPRFVQDVNRIQVGMEQAEVDAVMSEHVKGAFGKGEQVHDPRTYYEPQKEHHSYDQYALVSWESGRVSDVSLHLD